MSSITELGGILTGVVDDLDDPERLGRVRVRFPTLDGMCSGWARVVSAGAGSDRGVFFRPEPDDEVLVAFELGDLTRPFVLGGLWNRRDPHPADDGDSEANNWRTIRSRSGHMVKLDDTEGSERIEIVDKDEKRRIVIDCADESLVVSSDAGAIEVNARDGDVRVRARGDVSVDSSAGDVDVSAPAGAIELKAARDITIRADANCTIEAGGVLTLKGSLVKIN